MKGSQRYCPHYLAFVLSFSCSSVWSAPPSARWDSFEYCPVAQLLLSAFAAFPVFVHWVFGGKSLAPCPASYLCGRFSFPPLPPLSVLNYSSLFMFFSFAGQFRMLPSGSGDQLWDPLPVLLWEMACCPTPTLILCCLSCICSLRV
jgi:hypothetical protein